MAVTVNWNVLFKSMVKASPSSIASVGFIGSVGLLDEEELDRELASIQMGALPSSTTATPVQAYPVQQQPAAEVPMPMAATTTNNWRDELNNL